MFSFSLYILHTYTHTFTVIPSPCAMSTRNTDDSSVPTLELSKADYVRIYFTPLMPYLVQGGETNGLELEREENSL